MGRKETIVARKWKSLVYALFFAVAGLGHHAVRAATQCEDRILGDSSRCELVGLFSKSCCGYYAPGDYRYWTSLTEKWHKVGTTVYYWTNWDLDGDWHSSCTPSAPLTCC